MKIAFAGGGGGGDFYALMAVAQQIRTIEQKEQLSRVRMYYFCDTPYNPEVLFEQQIAFKKISGRAGFLAYIKALMSLFSVFPDVLFVTAGEKAYSISKAASILGIPVVMHETDSKSDEWSVEIAKIADRISVSFPDTPKKLLPFKKRISHVGHPVRKLLIEPIKDGAREYLQLESETPVLLFLGGSRGSEQVNSVMLRILPELVSRYHVIHQTGKEFHADVIKQANSVLYKNEHSERYQAFQELNELSLAMVAGVATAVVSRAGSVIFEFAIWELPAVLVPEAGSAFEYQKHNAYAYAHAGGAVVIEDANLEPHILLSEIGRLTENNEARSKMQDAANSFARPNAALVIARELVLIAKSHIKV